MRWPFVSRAREHDALVRYVVSAVLKADLDNVLYRPGQFVPLREDNVRRCLDWLVSIANERREIMAKLEEDKASMAEAHAATRAELEAVQNREAHLAARLVDAVRLLSEYDESAMHLARRLRMQANGIDQYRAPRTRAYSTLCVSSRQLIAESGIAEHLSDPLPGDLLIEPAPGEEAPRG